MLSSSIARRYAKALSAIGQDDGQLEAYGDELSRVVKAHEASEELRDIWSNPAYSRESRLATITALVQHLKLSTSVGNLLQILVERERMGHLESIAQAYSDIVDSHVGRVRAVITSATPLPDEVAASLKEALEKESKAQITLSTQVDPSLIGGVVAQVGSTVLDGSVRAQLLALKKELDSAPLGQSKAE